MAVKKALVLSNDGEIQQLQPTDTLEGAVATGNYTESDTIPLSATVGDEWLDTTNGVLYKYISDGTTSAWIDIMGAGVIDEDLDSGGA
jgi:hypothetical protein